MRGISLFHPPLAEKAITRSRSPPDGEVRDPLTWTKYDGSQVPKGRFEFFNHLPIELQLLIWKTCAEGWIADQEGEKPCTLDNVVYSNPLRIRMKLPGLPAVFHVCSLSREVTYDVLREICLVGNARKVVDAARLKRFGDVYRRTNVNAGRESTVHLQKTDRRGGKSTVTVKTYTWMVLRDFRLGEENGRRRRRDPVVDGKD